MPWHIGKTEDCDGFAVIKDDDDSVAGCHETEDEAKAQLAALYANETSESEGDGPGRGWWGPEKGGTHVGQGEEGGNGTESGGEGSQPKARKVYRPTESQEKKWAKFSATPVPTDDEFKARWKKSHHGKETGWGMGKRDWVLNQMTQSRDYQIGIWQGRVDKARGIGYSEERIDNTYNLGYFRGYSDYESDRRGWDSATRDRFEAEYLGESGSDWTSWELPEEIAEAATTKKRLQALARDIELILADRSVPSGLRKEIEDVRTSLKKTWADLGTEADGEKEEPDMDAQETMDPIMQVRGLMEQALAILTNLQEAEPEALPVAEADEPAKLSESAIGRVIAIEEAQVKTDRLVPLTLDVAVIEPGPGNAKDGHYYPANVLRRDAGVFRGVKMFATDHRQDEKSVGTWVSTVKACPVGFTESGAPIARVVVHKDWFAQDVLSLKEAGMLDRMECSILGTGKAKRGKVGESEYNIVEAITAAEAVDWVSRAGAGGHALSLAESDVSAPQTEDTVDEQEEKEVVQESETVTLREENGEQPQESPEPATLEDTTPAEAALSADQVSTLLSESGLDEDAQKLLTRAYDNEQAVQDAIAEFKQILKRASGSGRPFAQGATQPAQKTQLTEADRVKRYRDIVTRYGLDYPELEVSL